MCLPSSRALAWALVALWGTLVWWLLTGTRIRITGTHWWGPWLTNLAHAPLFGGQAALLALALRDAAAAVAPPRMARRRVLAAALLALAYGVLLEWVQAHTPGRRASSLDVLTDAVGAFGVPWALAAGTWWNRRTTAVVLLASLAAAAATWWR